MSEEKKEISPFQLADSLHKLLSASGASKKLVKEALGLVASQHGLRLVPVGVPLERRAAVSAALAADDSKSSHKGGKKQKSGLKTDEAVVAAQKELDARLKEIRDLKVAGTDVPPQVVQRKEDALRALNAAKAAFRNSSQAKSSASKGKDESPSN